MGYILCSYAVGLLMGIGIMALLFANGRNNDDDFYNGGIV